MNEPMYKVFGYNDLCQDFEYFFDAFVPAINLFRELRKGMYEVWIDGVSEKTRQQIERNA